MCTEQDLRAVCVCDYNVTHTCVYAQNKTCVQTLEGHAQNISCVAFHPELPIILTGSEDGQLLAVLLLSVGYTLLFLASTES